MAWAKAQTAAWIAAATLGATAAASVAVEAVATPARPRVQFEGEGFLLRTNFVFGESWTNYFKVIVRDGEWRIVTQRPNQKSDFTEAGYDGSELVRITHFENFQNDYLRQSGVAGRTGFGYSTVADVQFSPIPYLMVNDGMLPVWFAYASQPYLDTARPGWLSPIVEPGDSGAPDEALVRMGYEQKAQLTRRAAPPGVPERAVFFNDGSVRNMRGLAARRAPFNQGFTNAIFQALAFTNLAGMEIPTHFTVSNFLPKADGTNANDVLCIYEWDVHLTNLLSTISVTRFKPESPKGVDFIQDYRFSAGNLYIPMVRYYLTNSDWPATRQVKLLPAYQEEAARGPRQAASQAQSDGLLDSDGNRVDRQHHASFHPLNFPHSLQKQRYPNTILLAFPFAGAALLGALLLRMAVHRATRPPK
jgi:hypothetical protein